MSQFQQVQYAVGINHDFEIVVIVSDVADPNEYIRMNMSPTVAEGLAQALIDKIAELETMETEIKEAVDKIIGEV